MTPPRWFEAIRRKVLAGWENREQNPEDLGVWEQLFSQIQYPHHVVSELIQNAEDAGASSVEVTLEGRTFVFRHDGHDFTEEEFCSLCRFGYSNKRNLWTIGFRGMGFKSLFSLGPTVEVLTPTIAVRFHRSRFTLPEWIEDARSRDSSTEIRIPVNGDPVFKKIEQQIRSWGENPLPLLFLEGIRELRVGETVRSAEPLGEGPVPGSHYFHVAGTKLKRILKLPLELGKLPPECLEEIQKERRDVGGFEDRTIQGVALLGRGVDRKIFVVLPTQVGHDFPIALHAPFLLAPSRSGLRDLSISPTNRWLLTRAGEELARILVHWLANQDLTLQERAEAYELLPPVKIAGGGAPPGREVTQYLLDGLRAGLEGQPIVLTCRGQIRDGSDVAALPLELLTAWEPAQVRKTFAPGKRSTLALGAAGRLDKILPWTGLDRPDQRDLLETFTAQAPPISRPTTFEALAGVWEWAKRTTENTWRDYDSRGQRKRWWRTARILPVRGSGHLGRREEVVRLPKERPDGVTSHHWDLLVTLVDTVDPAWIRYVEQTAKNDALLAELWSNLELERGVRLSELWLKVLAFLAQEERSEEHLANLLQIAASFELELTQEARDMLRFPCKDGQWRAVSEGLYLDTDGRLAELIPETRYHEQVVDTEFLSRMDQRVRGKVQNWLQEGVLHTFPPLEVTEERISGKSSIKQFLRSRGCAAPESYPYNYRGEQIFKREVVDWSKELWTYWESSAAWQAIGRLIVQNWHAYFKDMAREKVFMRPSNWPYSTKKKLLNDRVRATWLVGIQVKPILTDTSGKAATPSELVCPSPENEKVPGTRMLEPSLATPENEEALLALGVRKYATDPAPVLEHILALSRAGIMPLKEVRKLFETLQWILEKSRGADGHEKYLGELRGRIPVPTQNGWRSLDEVFLMNPDGIPGITTVHPELVDLGLWRWLGLRKDPRESDAVGWLLTLTGQALQGKELETAESVVRRYPRPVADQAVWLTLSGMVRPIKGLEWRVTDPPAGLVSWLREETADLTLLSDTTVISSKLLDLPSLDDRLERRLSEDPKATPLDGPGTVWLRYLGKLLAGARKARVETNTDLETLRIAGQRLARTEASRADRLLVEYALDGRIVSNPAEMHALWTGTKLFLSEPMSPRLEDSIVDEIGREEPSLPEKLLRQCYCRDEQWIHIAVAEWFEIEEEEIPQPEPSPLMSSGGGHENPESAPSPDDGSRMKGWPKHLVAALEANHFHWDEDGIRWRNDEGVEIWKTDGKHFPWAVCSGRRDEQRPAYLHAGRLEGGRALAIDFSAWHEGPSLGAVLIELDRDRLAVRPFRELHELERQGSLLVTPTKLRVAAMRSAVG